MIKNNKNQISLSGEFAALSKLSLLGFDASLTLGNTKGVDILVLNPSTEKMFRVEVKTSFKTGNYIKKSKEWGPCIEWILGQNVENNNSKDLFYIFVILDEKHNQRFFIIPSKIVSEYCRKEHLHWLSGGEKRKTSGMRTFRLGVDANFKYKIQTALVDNYENRWDLLK